MVVYAANSTPEISLDEFTRQLQDMQAEYDDYYVSEIIVENGSEFYYVDGEEMPLSDDGDIVAEVSKNNFEVPATILTNSSDNDISTYSLDDKIVTKTDAEALGFEVDIEDDTAILTQPYQTKRLIVKSKYDINPLDSVAIVEGYNDLHIVQFNNQESAKQAQEYYEKQKLIEYAEPDSIMSTMDIDYTPESSAVTSASITYDNHLSWGSESIGVDDYIDYLGDVKTLPEIVVGIIDTGIDLNHEYLQDRIIRTNYNLSSSGETDSENDDKGHGTHVAGIVADNTTDNVKIKAYKVLNNVGSGNTLNICLAIDYAVSDGVNVINMSLGGRKDSGRLEEETINRAVENGVIVCVSAGNSGRDANNYSPAYIDSCITVAAIDAYDIKPYWSNWGNVVDIVAPGVSIYSTYLENTYETLSGTSMACPFVSAAAALILCKNINYGSDEVCGILEDNGRIWYTENSAQYKDSLYGKRALYIGTVTDFNNDRTSMPIFSVESGNYTDAFSLEITCEDENAEIYYTTNGARANQDTGTLYTEPIVIDEITIIRAVAYTPGKLKSLQAVREYYLTYTDDESNFVIDSDGIITKYKGKSNYLTVPDAINGISVTGIGSSVFLNNSSIVMIKLPDTLTTVGYKAFNNCYNLNSVDCKNLISAGIYAFWNCRKLEKLDLSKLENADNFSFYNCQSMKSLYNDKLTTISKAAFKDWRAAINIELPNVTSIEQSGLAGAEVAESINIPKLETLGQSALDSASSIEEFSFPKLTTLSGDGVFHGCQSLKSIYAPKLEGKIPNNTFSFCFNLESLYIPFITEIGNNALEQCKSLKILFAPSLERTQSLPACNDVNMYLSDKFIGTSNSAYNCTVIAPNGSYAEQWVNENGHTFIPSDYRDSSVDSPLNVEDKGRSIRVTNAGLRFGFSWNEIPEIEELASDIEYGFVYHYNYNNVPFASDKLTVENVGTDNIKKKEAVNLDDTNDGETVFNLVFTNIPDSNQNTNISVRAYVCIDGMYFYSNSLNGSFSKVSNLVLADEEIDNSTKTMLKQILKSEV